MFELQWRYRVFKFCDALLHAVHLCTKFSHIFASNRHGGLTWPQQPSSCSHEQEHFGDIYGKDERHHNQQLTPCYDDTFQSDFQSKKLS